MQRRSLEELTDRWRARHDARASARPASGRSGARGAGPARLPVPVGVAGRVRRRARGRHGRVHLRRGELRRSGPRRVAARGRPPPSRAPMSAPAWAHELLSVVCADAGVAPPRLLWRERHGGPSTGVARRSEGTISVRAGSDALDQRLTLLHELAHWIAPDGPSSGPQNGPPRARLLRRRLRAVPSPRPRRPRCAPPRVGALPIGARPCRRARRGRGDRGPGRASVPATRSAASALARARPGACDPPRARWSLVGVRGLPAAGRRAEPAARAARSAARAPHADDRRLGVGQTAAGAPRRSRATAAASASRRTLSALRG